MKEYHSNNFNVERLLTLGDLDIRNVAEKNPSLSADEYFSQLEQFLETSYAEAFANSRMPDEVIAVLDEIGFYSFSGGAEAFNTLCERIRSAYTKKRTRVSQTLNKTDNIYADVLLAEALEYFDYLEAHRKLRILAVDDVSVALNTITSTLSPHYEVFALTKASQVADFLTHTTPELFLLDIEMPDLHGYDLLAVIRSFKEHKDTPIIFLTGNATAENISTAVSLGASDFIAKPINKEILLEKIANKIVWKKAF